MRLAGKRALLTAAGAGIGRATALAFAREGAAVVLTDVDQAALDETVSLLPEGAEVDAFLLDARDLASVKAGVERAGAIDILFNCAGWVHHGTILETTEDEWDFSFDLNVKSMWRTLTCALPGMIERGGGSVVNMSSAAGSLVGAPNRALYGATKAAVIGLTKAVATDHVTQGIRCNCICPGTVESPSLENRIKTQGNSQGGYDAARAAFVARQPMGRIATADEIAMLALYLASDESSFTTGHAHVIDGGWSNV